MKNIAPLFFYAGFAGLTGAIWQIMLKRSNVPPFTASLIFAVTQAFVLIINYLFKYPDFWNHFKNETSNGDYSLAALAGGVGALSLTVFTRMAVSAPQKWTGILFALVGVTTTIAFGFHHAWANKGFTPTIFLAFAFVCFAIGLCFKS